MRILIEVPTYDGRIARCTSESLWNLDRCGHEVDYMPRAGYGVAMARNRIAADALDGEYDRVLMVDNDVELPADALANLLECDADVCMGYYLNRAVRDGSGKTTIFKLGDGWEPYTGAELRALREAGTYRVRVKGGGMGCTLFKPWVFTSLPFPWFEWWDIGRRMLDASDVGACKSTIDASGEDITFCDNARAAGITIHADTRVACGHEFREVRWPE